MKIQRDIGLEMKELKLILDGEIPKIQETENQMLVKRF